MVARGEDHVAHACGFGQTGPEGRIKINRVKLLLQSFVDARFPAVHGVGPFASAGDGVEAPVEKQAKTGIGKPVGTIHERAPLQDRCTLIMQRFLASVKKK